MKIDTENSDVWISGSIIGTRFDEDDQKKIIKWFMANKPKLVRECKKELRVDKSSQERP